MGMGDAARALIRQSDGGRVPTLFRNYAEKDGARMRSCCLINRAKHPPVPGKVNEGLAGDVDGEVEIDGGGLVVNGAGAEVELADGLDDA